MGFFLEILTIPVEIFPSLKQTHVSLHENILTKKRLFAFCLFSLCFNSNFMEEKLNKLYQKYPNAIQASFFSHDVVGSIIFTDAFILFLNFFVYFSFPILPYILLGFFCVSEEQESNF